MKFKCETCGKVVTAKNGKLSCCGITENVKESIEANKDYARERRVRARDMMLNLLPNSFENEEEDYLNE